MVRFMSADQRDGHREPVPERGGAAYREVQGEAAALCPAGPAAAAGPHPPTGGLRLRP